VKLSAKTRDLLYLVASFVVPLLLMLGLVTAEQITVVITGVAAALTALSGIVAHQNLTPDVPPLEDTEQSIYVD